MKRKEMLRRFLILTLVVSITLLAGGCSSEKTGLFDLINWFLHQKSGLPLYSGAVAAAVGAPVEIYFDEYGVAHVLAGNEADLFYGQGYVHAMERLFQMDLLRRSISGELAEILGPELVESDRFSRTIGFRRAAEKSTGAISGETRKLLQAYADGVNDYIEQNRENLAPEFILLDYVPEPWDPVDSITISKMVAWFLGGNMDTELLLAALVDEVGLEKAAGLFPSYPEQGLTIMGPVGLSSKSALDLIALSGGGSCPQGFPGVGSNNWVVSGDRTASGGAMLASDMHLSLDLPPIWYMNYLSSPEIKVTGVMFPGIAGVIAGFNERIAWGETNLGPDVMDLYQIKFNAADDTLYLYNDEWIKAEVINERITVRGGGKEELRIRETCFGPVISDVIDLCPGDLPLCLRWTALDATLEADAMLDMIRASDFAEFRTALQNFMAPAQNFVYADVEGNIGYLGNGLFPIRSESHHRAGNGLLPVPGWSDEYAWTGWVPWEEIPLLYNPPEGLIVTANHKAVADDYPYFLSYEWAHPSRALSILREYDGRDNLTLEDMQAGQASFYNSHAAETVPLLVGLLEEAVLEGREEEALRILERWGRNPVETADSAGTAIFHRFYTLLINNIFEGQVTEELQVRLLNCSPLVIDRLLKAEETQWIDDPAALAHESFSRAVAELSRAMGEEISRWQWGKIHTISFKHSLGDAVSKRCYNRGPFEVGGSGHSPGALVHRQQMEQPYQVYGGAPWRYVIDLADHSAFDILAIGNSGHFRSPHYDDLLQKWLQMEYKERLFSRDEIEKLPRKLVLEPQGRGENAE